MTTSTLATALLDWNRRFLTTTSDLTKEKIADMFADNFTVIANGKTYSANHDNYFDFLNQFRSTIKSIDYDCDDFITDNDYVVIPMIAHIVRIDESNEKFAAILILQFNSDSKVILWKEVYVKL
jgi:hypothetical protein